MKNIGIIGHSENIKKISDIIKKSSFQIETQKIKFNHLNELENTIELIKSQESQLDAILFSGKIPFNILNSSMISKIPWVYLDTTINQLSSIFLKVILNYNLDIKKISIDSFSKDEILNLYKNINIDKNNISLHLTNPTIFDQKLIDHVIKTHISNYKKYNLSFCITNLYMVYETLKKNNIPCLILEPSLDMIKKALNHLTLKTKTNKNYVNQVAIISIIIDPLNDFSFINENEYQRLLQRTKITQEIYLFAQKIQGTVVEVSNNNYLIFCTKNILETETDNLRNLKLISSIENNTNHTISLGIGYGLTVREAKYNAIKAVDKASKIGNQAYVYKNNSFIGPISHISYKSNEKKKSKIIDKNLYSISQDTHISIKTLFKIKCLIDEEKNNTFTAKKLAELLDITHRSANRLIKKLIEKNYANIVGKKIIDNAGRPSRIIEIDLNE